MTNQESNLILNLVSFVVMLGFLSFLMISTSTYMYDLGHQDAELKCKQENK